MCGLDMKVNSLRGEQDGQYRRPYNPHNPHNTIWLCRWVIWRALLLSVFWTTVPAAALGVTGAAVFYVILPGCDFNEFTYFCYGISCLWLMFGLLDGVALRLFDRFMKGESYISAAIDGWFATDRKAVGWGPWWMQRTR